MIKISLTFQYHTLVIAPYYQRSIVVVTDANFIQKSHIFSFVQVQIFLEMCRKSPMVQTLGNNRGCWK